MAARRARSARREPAWTRLDDEALLDKRFCDLRLTVASSRLEPSIRRLYSELGAKGIRFRPHVWLSEEWFSPDGIPGIAIPFYLAHPRLQRLERRFMHEVEGGNDKWLMRILRHEAGHAIDTAFALRRRKAWRQVFGKASRRIRRGTRRGRPAALRAAPRPLVCAESSDRGLRRDVRRVAAAELALAQPVPRLAGARQARVRRRDDASRSRAGAPCGSSRDTIEPLADNRRTLREHYRRKQRRYEIDTDTAYDRRLLRVFGRVRGVSASTSRRAASCATCGRSCGAC